jgi:hypothetical protein
VSLRGTAVDGICGQWIIQQAPAESEDAGKFSTCQVFLEHITNNFHTSKHLYIDMYKQKWL